MSARLASFAAALAPFGAGAASAETRVVSGRGVAWKPGRLVVKRGDVVQWKNVDVVPHDVREDHKVFVSRQLQPGQSFKWTARKKGTFPYKCTLHPEMVGTLVVE